MFKFFRKIRQKLFTENKFRKYLLYAAGEIVLVVIGILLALQINNWNESRKLAQSGKEFIKEIYKELKIEVANIDEILKSLGEQYDGTEYVLAVIESKDKVIEDSLQFTKNHWIPTRLFIIDRDLNTFDKLKSSGQSSLLKNDSLSNLLDKFYQNFDTRISNFKEFPLQIRMDLRRATFPIGTMKDFRYEVENSKITAGFTEAYLNSELIYKHLLSILKTCRYNTGFFEELKEEALQLIHLMEQTYPELQEH